MNKQEIFDKAARHIKEQGAPAVNSKNHCKYRDDEGRACAIGAFIPDDKYNSLLEGQAIAMILERRATATFVAIINEIFQPEDHYDLQFLAALQEVHDAAATDTIQRDVIGLKQDYKPFMDLWRSQMRGLAREYNLDPKEVQDV